MAKTLNELEQGCRRWREQVAHDRDLQGGVVVGFKHDQAMFETWVTELCDAYINGSSQDRRRIREMVCDGNILWLLNGFPLLLCKSVKTSADRDKVVFGLVAPLIIDGRGEARETDYSMRALLTAAAAAGIDHVGLLQEIRRIAETAVSRKWLDDWSLWKPVLPKPPFRLEGEIAKSAGEIAQGERAWFYQDGDGASVGPLTTRSVRECRYRGVITAKTMVREATNPEAAWKTASEFQEIVPRVSS